MMEFDRRTESRRKELRFPVSLSLQLQIEGQDRIFGHSINISRRGLLCSVPREDLALFTRTKVFLDLVLPNQDVQTVECEGVIFRIENGSADEEAQRVAIYFHRLEEQKARKIRNCLIREAKVPETELTQYLALSALKSRPNGANLSGHPHLGAVSGGGFNRASFFHSLEQLTQALVEEIRNPLAGISTALEMVASSSYHLESPYQDVYQEIFRDLGRIDDAVSTLLYYCNPVPPRMRLLSLERLVDDCIAMMVRDGDPAGRAIKALHGPDQPKLWGDDHYLQQALLVALQHFDDQAGPGHQLKVFSFFKVPPVGFDLPGNFIGWREGDGRLKFVVTDDGPDSGSDSGPSSIDSVAEEAGVNFPLLLRNVEMHGGEVYWCSGGPNRTALVMALPAAQGLDH